MAKTEKGHGNGVKEGIANALVHFTLHWNASKTLLQ